jgi:hypothetical protein
LGSLQQVLRCYPNLFSGTAEGENEGSGSIESGWLSILDSLSQGDFTKWDYYLYDIKLIQFLNYVALTKDKLKNATSAAKK